VIGGELRGRRLSAPDDPLVRPTSDRVREAVFDILYSLGGVDGLQVADLCAGSGAMGIEALSRGAASVTFVDHSAAALAAVRANLSSVGLQDAEHEGDATVVRADVASWAATTASRYDVIFCDPPYDYSGWEALVSQLPGDLAVLESGSAIVPPSGGGVIKTKRYGSTIVTVARPQLVTEKGVS
jgi:16S rRNA (guanine966-N2)-methyltransferase